MSSSAVEIISATGNLLAPIAAILGAFLTAYLTKIWNTDEPNLPRYTPDRQLNTLPPREALPRYDPPIHTLYHAQYYSPHTPGQTPQYREHRPLRHTEHQLPQNSPLYRGQTQYYQPNN